MNRAVTVIVFLLLLSYAAAQTKRSVGNNARQTPLKLTLEIQKVTTTKFGYDVSVRLKNVSPDRIVLARSGTNSPILQSLDVQQWDDKLGWQSVGPCGDVPPSTTLDILPQRDMQDIVPIGDVEHGWTNSVCPRKIRKLGGKIRAVIYCTYRSKQQFTSRMECHDCCATIASTPFDLPKSGQ